MGPSFGRSVVKVEQFSEFGSNNGVKIKNEEDDDPIIGDLTLKELQLRHKTKRKKILKSGHIFKQETGYAADLDGASNNDVFINLGSNDDDSYMDKPLSAFRKKSSKKRKFRCIKEYKMSSSLGAIDHHQSSENIELAFIKIENPELSLSEYCSFPTVEHLGNNNLQQLPLHIHEETIWDYNYKVYSDISGSEEYFDTQDLSYLENGNVTPLLCAKINDSSQCDKDGYNGATIPLLTSEIDRNLSYQNCHCHCEGDSIVDGCLPIAYELSASYAAIRHETSSFEIRHCDEVFCVGDKMVDDFPIKPDEMSRSLVTEGQKTEARSSDLNSAVVASEAGESHLGVWLDCPPKRILSARKVLSPTSQEELRQAAGYGDEHSNLNYNNSEVKEPESTEEFNKNLKNEPQGFLPKGILKVPKVSLGKKKSDVQSTSNNNQTEKIVAFAQQQMFDCEGLSMKIIANISSLKDIVEDRLCTITDLSAPPKYTAEEMKIAIEKTVEVQETTRKWISMMRKDCKRFCKIMLSPIKKCAAASNYLVHHKKKNRKVVFADETGGMLQHIKFFGDYLPEFHSSPESEDCP